MLYFNYPVFQFCISVISARFRRKSRGLVPKHQAGPFTSFHSSSIMYSVKVYTRCVITTRLAAMALSRPRTS